MFMYLGVLLAYDLGGLARRLSVVCLVQAAAEHALMAFVYVTGPAARQRLQDVLFEYVAATEVPSVH